MFPRGGGQKFPQLRTTAVEGLQRHRNARPLEWIYHIRSAYPNPLCALGGLRGHFLCQRFKKRIGEGSVSSLGMLCSYSSLQARNERGKLCHHNGLPKCSEANGIVGHHWSSGNTSLAEIKWACFSQWTANWKGSLEWFDTQRVFTFAHVVSLGLK